MIRQFFTLFITGLFALGCTENNPLGIGGGIDVGNSLDINIGNGSGGGGVDVGNPLDSSSLAFVGYSLTDIKSGVSTTDAISLRSGASITSSTIQIQEIKFHYAGKPACLQSELVDDSAHFESIRGPFLVNLLTGASTPSLKDLPMPEGKFCRIDVLIGTDPSTFASLPSSFHFEGKTMTGVDFLFSTNSELTLLQYPKEGMIDLKAEDALIFAIDFDILLLRVDPAIFATKNYVATDLQESEILNRLPDSLSVLRDSNGDGRPDQMEVQNPIAISTLIGTTAYSNWVTQPKLVDLNNDGKLDLLTTDSSSRSVAYLGDGNAGFKLQDIFNIDAGTEFPADINGDGILDLVGAGQKGIRTHRGRGDGTFESPIDVLKLQFIWTDVKAADFDLDGDIDFIVGDDTNKRLLVFHNNGDGTFRLVQKITNSYARGEMVIANFDADPELELVEASNTPGWGANYFDNDGSGKFIYHHRVSDSLCGISLAIADFNRDGNLDLVSSVGKSVEISQISVVFGNGDGTFRDPLLIQAKGISSWVGAFVYSADLNRDKAPDIIHSDGDAKTITIIYGNGDGTFKPKTTLAIGTTAEDVLIGDVTGDGIKDLLARRKWDSFLIFEVSTSSSN